MFAEVITEMRKRGRIMMRVANQINANKLNLQKAATFSKSKKRGRFQRSSFAGSPMFFENRFTDWFVGVLDYRGDSSRCRRKLRLTSFRL